MCVESSINQSSYSTHGQNSLLHTYIHTYDTWLIRFRNIYPTPYYTIIDYDPSKWNDDGSSKSFCCCVAFVLYSNISEEGLACLATWLVSLSSRLLRHCNWVSCVAAIQSFCFVLFYLLGMVRTTVCIQRQSVTAPCVQYSSRRGSNVYSSFACSRLDVMHVSNYHLRV